MHLRVGLFERQCGSNETECGSNDLFHCVAAGALQCHCADENGNKTKKVDKCEMSFEMSLGPFCNQCLYIIVD